jgi:hypothetical protein
MKNAYKLAFTAAALFITCSLSAQNSPTNTGRNSTGVKSSSTTTTTTTGTGTGTVTGTNDGTKTGTRNTTTGTSEKMAIGDQGTVEDKKTNKNGTGDKNQITPKK